MAVTFTEQYETKKAFVDMSLSDGTYTIEYVATGPIDGTPDNVDATIYAVSEEKKSRIGYGSFKSGITSLRFDVNNATTVSNQATMAAQFYNDLQSILG